MAAPCRFKLILFTALSLALCSCLRQVPSCCLIEASPKQSAGSGLLELSYSKGALEQHFLVQYESRAETAVLVGFSPLQTRWFTVSSKGKGYLVDSTPFPPLPFDPVTLFCDLTLLIRSCQLLNAPLSEGADRIPYLNKSPDIEIECALEPSQQRQARLKNIRDGYTLKARSVTAASAE